jgi:hypothetical protein
MALVVKASSLSAAVSMVLGSNRYACGPLACASPIVSSALDLDRVPELHGKELHPRLPGDLEGSGCDPGGATKAGLMPVLTL